MADTAKPKTAAELETELAAANGQVAELKAKVKDLSKRSIDKEDLPFFLTAITDLRNSASTGQRELERANYYIGIWKPE